MNAVTKETELQARFSRVNNSSSLLCALWQVAESKLTHDEWKIIAGCGDGLAIEMDYLADSISSVACLVSSDHNTAEPRCGVMDDCSPYLFSISNQLSVLARAQVIVSEATSYMEMNGGAAAQ